MARLSLPCRLTNYIPSRFTRSQTVTHPVPNRARRTATYEQYQSFGSALCSRRTFVSEAAVGPPDDIMTLSRWQNAITVSVSVLTIHQSLTSISNDVVVVINQMSILVILDVVRPLFVLLLRQQQLHNNQHNTYVRIIHSQASKCIPESILYRRI